MLFRCTGAVHLEGVVGEAHGAPQVGDGGTSARGTAWPLLQTAPCPPPAHQYPGHRYVSLGMCDSTSRTCCITSSSNGPDTVRLSCLHMLVLQTSKGK